MRHRRDSNDLHRPVGYGLEIPVVNRNGTEKRELVEQFWTIKRMLEDVNTFMAGATPHGRDFQTMSEGEVTAAKAREAFAERRTILRAMAREFEAVAIAINGQD